MADSSGDCRYHVLVEFAFKHLDFQMAELESVLAIHGMSISDNEADGLLQCCIEELPGQNEQGHGEIDISSILLDRCVLVRGVIELWGLGESIEACANDTLEWTQGSGKDIFQRERDETRSWKITIHTLGSKYGREEQEAMRAHFRLLDLKGPVQMKNPSNEFVFIQEVELDEKGGSIYPRIGPDGNVIEENVARPPLGCYFGRTLGDRRCKGRGGVEKYNLKKRNYLGPTSMDAELSFIMTNLGRVRRGSFVFDPFVGTGSILLSCALRGACCMGTDIDIRILRGRSKEQNVYSNFRQFNLPRPELVRSDTALYHRHFRGHAPLYDAIICDPPYGIRAGARRTGSRLDNPRPILDEHRHDHIAQTKPYIVSDVMGDLLDVAARTLVLGGFLVCIIPSYSDFDAKEDLPQHECLELSHSCYQPLSLELGRRVVTMRKVKYYDPAKQTEYMSKVWKNGTASAEKCANIRDKLIEAAKKKPRYEERSAIRKQKRREHKETKKRAKNTL